MGEIDAAKEVGAVPPRGCLAIPVRATIAAIEKHLVEREGVAGALGRDMHKDVLALRDVELKRRGHKARVSRLQRLHGGDGIRRTSGARPKELRVEPSVEGLFKAEETPRRRCADEKQGDDETCIAVCGRPESSL
jgi:hypothetical protein